MGVSVNLFWVMLGTICLILGTFIEIVPVFYLTVPIFAALTLSFDQKLATPAKLKKIITALFVVKKLPEDFIAKPSIKKT